MSTSLARSDSCACEMVLLQSLQLCVQSVSRAICAKLRLCAQHVYRAIRAPWQQRARYVYRHNCTQTQVPSLPADEKESLALDPFIPHEIFLSHSGAQKGFVKDLYEELSGSYGTFLDIKHHALPLGENFPKRILHAAQTCQLAVVVLSEEFVCSKWPMVELCAFVDAGVDILPLFYKLLPGDLKHQGNLKRWKQKWKIHAKEDVKHLIVVSKWANALTTLCSQNGVTFNPASEGEKTYLNRIMLGIYQKLPVAFKLDTCKLHGKDRLCKILLDKFKEMEIFQVPQPKVSVLGLYGLGGSGKSTLCKCLRDHFGQVQLYGPNKTLYLEMPSHPSLTDVVHKFKELLHLTDFRNRMNLDKVSEVEQVEDLLKKFKLPHCRVFLVVDNISDKSWKLVHRILDLGVGPGSKVILVARTLDVLLPTLESLQRGGQCLCANIAIPSINKREAVQILLQTAGASYMGSDTCASFKKLSLQESKIVQGVVQMCSFHGNQYLPLVMESIGAMLVKYEGDLESWGSCLKSFWTIVKTCKADIVKDLVGESFKALLDQQLQLLFLDVALFVSRLQCQELQTMDEVTAFLCLIHGGTATIGDIKKRIKDLQRHCFLMVSEDNIISVHDVYLEFAESIQNDPSSFLSSSIRWCWGAYEITGPEEADHPRAVALKEEEMKPEQYGLRTLILEVGNGCERVDLQGFSCLKAVVLRNCTSLKVLGLAGLSSLVCLSCEDCASLQIIECSDMSLHNVKWLRTVGEKSKLFSPISEWKGEIKSRAIVPTKRSYYWSQLQGPSVIERCPESFHQGSLPCLKRLRLKGPAWPFSDDMQHDFEN